jgi:hypothetical protein
MEQGVTGQTYWNGCLGECEQGVRQLLVENWLVFADWRAKGVRAYRPWLNWSGML